jgi:hypothetical protein
MKDALFDDGIFISLKYVETKCITKLRCNEFPYFGKFALGFMVIDSFIEQCRASKVHRETTWTGGTSTHTYETDALFSPSDITELGRTLLSIVWYCRMRSDRSC